MALTKRGIGLALAGGAIGVASIFIVRPIYVFGVVFGLWQPWARPPGVSEAAHYVSRIEDGTWFDCTLDSKRNVDVCRAWDSDGRLLADGDFRLECQGRAASNAELRPSSVSSSGGHAYAVYLFGDKGSQTETLVPVTSEHDNPCPHVAITSPSTREGTPSSDSSKGSLSRKQGTGSGASRKTDDSH